MYILNPYRINFVEFKNALKENGMDIPGFPNVSANSKANATQIRPRVPMVLAVIPTTGSSSANTP